MATFKYQSPTILTTMNLPHTSTQLGLSRFSHGTQIMILSSYTFTMTRRTTLILQVLASHLLLKVILTTAIEVDGSGGWYYPWNVSIPDTISEDISTFRLLIQDSDTGDHLAWSRRLSILSPGELESAVPSITSSYFLGTLTVDWLTTISTASAESSPSGQSKSEAVPSKDSEKDSSSKSWVGPVAGLGGLWALTLLSLAGFCFYRTLSGASSNNMKSPLSVPTWSHTILKTQSLPHRSLQRWPRPDQPQTSSPRSRPVSPLLHFQALRVEVRLTTVSFQSWQDKIFKTILHSMVSNSSTVHATGTNLYKHGFRTT